MRINPSIMASAIGRYQKAIRQEKANPVTEGPKDKVELSENAKIYNNLIKAAQSSDDISMDKIHGVMNQIAAGTYHVDVGNIVDKMLKSR